MDSPARNRFLVPTFAEGIAVAAGFLVLAFAIYGISLGNKFVAWDDTYLIYFNPAVKSISFSTLKTIFTTYDPELYIPLTFFSYQIDYLLGGLNPAVYHTTSLILHTCSALLVAWLAWQLSGRKWAGVLCGLLFLVHPLNTEAVSWASGRKDVLSTALFLGCLLAYTHYRSVATRTSYLTSVVLFLLALMAKVSVIMGPLVLLLLDFREYRRFDRKMFLEKIPFFALSLVFGIVAMFGKRDVTGASSIVDKILMAGKSAVFYLEKLLWPTNLGVIYPWTKPIGFTADFLLPLAIVVLLSIAALCTLRRTREVVFGWVFFLLILSPSFLNFLKGGDAYFASDRYAYVPAIALFYLASLGIALLVEKALARRGRNADMKGWAIICAIVVLFLSWEAHKQSRVWANSEMLFLNTLKTYPDAIGARINLALVYRESDRMEESMEQLQEGLKLRPHTRIYTNLAAWHKKKGDVEKALEFYRKASVVDPHDPEPFFGIGIIYAQQKRYAEALELYEKALALNSQFVGIYNNIGALYLEQGDEEKAEQYFRRALEVDPYFVDAQYNLASLLKELGRTDEAIDAFEKAVAIDPESLDAVQQLALLYAHDGQHDEAIDMIRSALRLKPTDAAVIDSTLEVVKIIGEKDPRHEPSIDLLKELQERGVLQKKEQIK